MKKKSILRIKLQKNKNLLKKIKIKNKNLFNLKIQLVKRIIIIK